MEGDQPSSVAYEDRDRRWWADVIDVWAVPSLVTAVGFVLGGDRVLPGLVAALVLVVGLVGAETVTGRTPGKAALGLEVRRVDGRPASLRDVATRRVWMLVYLVLPVIGHGLSSGVAFVVLLSVLWTISRDPEGRGWHDRLAGTVVVRSDGPDTRVPMWAVGLGLMATAAVVVLAGYL